MDRIACVGAGLIGQAWAIVFARAGRDVVLHDPDRSTLEGARDGVAARLRDLKRFALIDEPDPILARITTEPDLQAALAGAAHVQESAPERIGVKQALYIELDRLAAPATVLASSTSGIPASAFTEPLEHRERCLVAHPINPPYLVPLVELCPAPWTAPETVERTHALMRSVGQAPVRLHHETAGFIANRMQAALIGAALRMAADGVASIDDIDTAIRDGIGLRWSFMGPFETIDLNAPGGIRDYLERYGPLYQSIEAEHGPLDWTERGLLDQVERGRRERLAADRLKDRSAWRDRRLMALVAHKSAATNDIGE
ncbi:MAG TPA: 3-hydroxyacyl-CoA dehydrogenase [Geminicoccaceae bacterium]